MLFLVQVYYTHPGFRTSIFGKNRAYCIRDFTVVYPRPLTGGAQSGLKPATCEWQFRYTANITTVCNYVG